MTPAIDAEPRARDVIRDWPVRAVVGQRLSDRIGARAFKPPRFARGRSLFGRCGLPDPWDPDAEQVDVGLGDVSLPQDRRQPAPHAAPPGSTRAGPKLPNVPAAPRAGPRPTEASSGDGPAGKAAPAIGSTRSFDKSELRPKTESITTRPKAPPKKENVPSAFGGGAARHAVAKLPVRPGFEPPEPGDPIPASKPDPRAAPAMSPAAPLRPAPSAPRPVTRSPEPASAPSPPRPSPVDSAATAPTPRQVAAANPPPAPTPRSTAPAPPERPSIPAPPAAEAAPPTPKEAPRAPAPLNRKPPSAGGGLDDLFGMGAGDNTRIKLPKAPAEGEAPKPRRPMVSSPEELAKLGLDRRPPPPKAPPPPAGAAPSAKPGGPGGNPGGDDGLPDE
jgi:Wiskott-Aldrich syndrome protein